MPTGPLHGRLFVASLRAWSHVGRRGSNLRRRLFEPATHRQSSCRFCGALFRLCAGCDRGQVTCAGECSRAHRKAQVRAAGRAYRASRRGRRTGAWRQRRYREAKFRARFVTHHPATSPPGSARVTTPPAFAVPVNPEVSVDVVPPVVSDRSPPRGSASPMAHSVVLLRCSRCLAELVPHASRGRAHAPRIRRRGGTPRHAVGPPRR